MTSQSNKKPKLVRDSFTIPKAEFAAVETMKNRAIALGTSVKKSELLRAGLMALQALDDVAFKAALSAVPTLKTGRPTGTESGTDVASKPVTKAAPKKATKPMTAQATKPASKPAVKTAARVPAGKTAAPKAPAAPLAKKPAAKRPAAPRRPSSTASA